MSSLSTPTRVGRGVAIPGIDTTKSGLDRPPHLGPYCGLPTPPQSAHESRRPSLQFLSETIYPPTPFSYPYSHPATPIHSMSQSVESFAHGWTDSGRARTEMSRDFQSSCQISEQALQSAFLPHAECSTAAVNGTPTYQHHFNVANADTYGAHELTTGDVWHATHQTPHAYSSQAPCLGPALFNMSQGMNLDSNTEIPVYDTVPSSLHELDNSLDTTAAARTLRGYSQPSSFYQHPQVVVPSQLSPQEDYSQHSFSDCSNNADQGSDGFASSFGSSVATFSGYETMRPPSPMETYFAQSDEEEWAMVKAEEDSSPASAAALRRSVTAKDVPTRPRRRFSRRPRNPAKAYWYKGYCGDIEVRCEGKEFEYTDDGRTFPLKASIGKLHKCPYVDENGTACNRRFDRSEHLKRHMGMHTSVRHYPCPLEDCDKKIQRPDNAADHFKTHLRGPKKGKRNLHVEWLVLHNAIWSQYEEKKAKKIIDNLQKWIDAGMPGTSGSRKVTL